MSPEADKILRLAGQRLMTNIAPLLGTAFGMGTMGLTNIMLGLVAQEYERGADIRAAENNELRALFEELAPAATDEELRTRLLAASRSRDASLRISVLNEANYALRRLLTQLHAHVETVEGPFARSAERRIWSLLKTIAERRIVSMTPAQ
jgi:hypothetical protein